MYWMMECYRSLEGGGRSIESWPVVVGAGNWLTGERFTAPIAQPIVLYWDPEDESGPPKALYKAGIPMISRRMHKTLLDAGVDNIDTYTVQVRSRTSGEVNDDFVAFNVIGLVRAADMSRSRYDKSVSPALLAVAFDSVTIDESATAGALLFRLAENVSAIVVHDRIKRTLDSAKLALTFVPPEGWAG